MDNKNKSGKLVIAAFIFFLALAIFITLFMLPVFDIKDIKINGLDNLTAEQVEGMLTSQRGDNIFLLNKSKSIDNIMASHYVENVKINRIFPSTVVVDLNEYKLRGYVPYMGSYLYINENGLILDIQKKTTRQLPVVEGLKFNDFTLGKPLKVDNPSAFDTMVEFAKLFEKHELLADVIRVDISDVSNIHLYTGKIDVEFGSFDNANRKLSMLNEVLKHLDTNYAGVLNLTGANPTFRYMT